MRRFVRVSTLVLLTLLAIASLAIWVASFSYVASRSLQRTTAYRGKTSSLSWTVAVFPNRIEAFRSSSEHVVTTQLNPNLADRPPKVLESSGGGVERLRPKVQFPDEPWRKPWPVWRRAEQAGGVAHTVSVPLAWPTVACTAPPLLALIRAWRRRRRAARTGLCRVCRFDLRASPARCPECGTPVPTAAVTG